MGGDWGVGMGGAGRRDGCGLLEFQGGGMGGDCEGGMGGHREEGWVGTVEEGWVETGRRDG